MQVLHIDPEILSRDGQLLLVWVQIDKRLNLLICSQSCGTSCWKYSFLLVEAESWPDLKTRGWGCSILKASEYSLFILVGKTRMDMLLLLDLGATYVSLGQPLPLYRLLIFGLSSNKDKTCMTFMVLRMTGFHYYCLYKIINQSSLLTCSFQSRLWGLLWFWDIWFE